MSLSSITGSSSFDPTTLYQSLFKKIDSDSNGSISKSEFEAAVSSMAKSENLTTDEADTLFSKLDTSGDGTVDSTEMMSALKSAGDRMRASMPPPPPPPPEGAGQAQNDTLTDDQKTTVASILSKYDASNLTTADAKAINQAFSDAGIPFGKGLGDTMEADGFSVKTMMSLDPPSGGNAANASSGTGSENAVFADLIKSMQSSSDDSSESTLLSGLIESFKSSGTSSSASDISSLFSGLLSQLQNGSTYSQFGSTSVSSASISSLMSTYA